MIEVHAEATVSRSAEEAFAFIADMSNNPRWQKGMRECRWTSEPPLRLGSTYDQVARFLGKEIVSSFEVTEFEQDRLIRIQTTKSSIPLDITRTVESLDDDRSRVAAIVRGDSSGLFRLADPIMSQIVQRSVRRDYQRLTELLDS